MRTLIKKGVAYVFLTVVAITVIIPFVYIVLISFGEYVTDVSSVIPKSFTLNNYIALFTKFKFSKWMINSLILSFSSMILCLIMTSITVYVLSRLKFTGKEQFFNIILLVQIFPLTLSMVSINKIFVSLGLLNKLSGLVIIDSVMASMGLVLLAKGFFDTIPYELDEAAMIDGANIGKILIYIILPLVKPMLAIVAIQSFVLTYNEYVIANVVMTNGFDSMTLAVGLQSMITGQYGTNWSVYCAGAVVGSVPMLILFYSLQKYFIAGLTDGGIKF